MSTVTKQRQLNLDELRRLKWLLGGVMALVSLWTVFFLDIEALGLVGIISVVVLAALIWPQFPAQVPALIWKLAVPGIIVIGAVDFYLSPDTLPVLIRLAILLVFYRSVAYRRKREDLQLIVLGMFLIVVAGVLTVSLGFAFLLLLFTALALGFLFVINLIDATETSGPVADEAGTAWTRLDGRNFLKRLRAVADWRMLGFAMALFTTVVVMSGVLFLIIPRFELASGFFLDRYISRKSRTGFTENVKFGDVTELVRDNSVAMRVDLTDSSGLLERPYWRLVVLDEYTPQGLRMSAEMKAELLRSQRVKQTIQGRGSNPGLRPVGGEWTFFIEPGVSRFLPLPGSFGTLRLRDQIPIQSSLELRLVALRTESMAMAAFRLEGVEQTTLLRDPDFAGLLAKARSNSGKPADPKKYNPLINLIGPAGAENRAVLQRIIAGIEGGASLSAEEFAKRATAWLQVHHSYAMAVKVPEGAGKDDIVRWLDSSEPGYCEYFAAGFTVLARAAGYPARLITGFRGGALNAFENYYMVRNSDAHAWAEIYDGKNAWLRIDPTPGAASTAEALAAQVAGQEHDSSWAARFDSLRVLWYRRIVNFDSRTQVEMLEKVKTLTLDSSSAIRARFDEWSKQLKTWLGRPWNVARLGKILGFVIFAGAVIWSGVLLVRWSWVRARCWLRPQEFDPVRREAGLQLTRLRAGRPVAPGVTDEQWTPVIEDLQRLRYGRRETWPEPQGVFRRARQTRKLLKR
jgi:protein-glutamine gamma-glutamyltransferase